MRLGSSVSNLPKFRDSAPSVIRHLSAAYQAIKQLEDGPATRIMRNHSEQLGFERRRGKDNRCIVGAELKSFSSLSHQVPVAPFFLLMYGAMI